MKIMQSRTPETQEEIKLHSSLFKNYRKEIVPLSKYSHAAKKFVNVNILVFGEMNSLEEMYEMVGDKRIGSRGSCVEYRELLWRSRINLFRNTRSSIVRIAQTGINHMRVYNNVWFSCDESACADDILGG
jgi:hypothetical protein